MAALGTALVLAGAGCGGSTSAFGHGILLVGHEYEKSRIFLWRPGSPVKPLTAAYYGFSRPTGDPLGLSEGYRSPDGRSIAFELDSDGGLAPQYGAIYVMRSDGSHVKLVSDSSYAPDARDGVVGDGDGPPSWSPDGRHIVYERFDNGSPSSDLAIVDVGSGAERTLPFSGDSPVWGTAGIAYSSGFGIMLLNPATGRSQLMARGFNDTFAWSPDGVLAAVENTRIVLLAGSGQVVGELPIPQPATGDVCAIAWSPDGKQILAATDAKGNPGLWVGTVSTKHWQRLPPVPTWKKEGNYECAVNWR